MNSKQSKPRAGCRRLGGTGFTLLELLVVVAITGVLTALLLPALSRAKSAGLATVCKGHLNQIGRATAMYVAEAKRYPPLEELQELDQGRGAREITWADRLYLNAPLAWTNTSWHCPTYIARGGLVYQKDYLYPPRTARNWNRDNHPHPELWAPASAWAIRN